MSKRLAAGPNLYRVLGVSSSASNAEIRSGYRRMALQSHPDKGGSKELFQMVVSAFETLSSTLARKTYDKWLMNSSKMRRAARRTQPKASWPVSPGRRSSKHSAAGKPRRLMQALRQLHKVLEAFQDKEERRSALQELPVSVSAALLLFMEHHAERRAGPGTAQVNGDKYKKQCGHVATLTDRIDGHKSLATQHEETSSKSGRTSRQTRTGCRGVMHATRMSRLYQSCVQFKNLHVVTRSVQTLEEAIEFHALLVAIKEKVAEKEDSGTFGSCVRDAIETVCRENNTDPSVLGLSFRVVVNARQMVRTAVCSRYSNDLSDTVRQRDMLLNAKAAGWPSFRAAWVEIMQLPSPTRKMLKSSQAMNVDGSRTEAQAAKVADAAWEAHCERRKLSVAEACRREEKRAILEASQLARRERAQRSLKLRMSRAVRVVEKAAAAERRSQARQVMAAKRKAAAIRNQEAVKRKHDKIETQKQEREKRRRRQQMWRWMKDPSRTTQEILQGPPPTQ